jgi:hypothetical protein
LYALFFLQIRLINDLRKDGSRFGKIEPNGDLRKSGSIIGSAKEIIKYKLPLSFSLN